MRVVLVVPAFPKRSETFIVAKAVGLLQRGVDLHVVCATSDEDDWRSFSADGPISLLRDRVHRAPRRPRRADEWTHAASSIVALGVEHRDRTRAYLRAHHGSRARQVRDLAADAALLACAPDVVHFEFGHLARGRTGLRERLGCALTVSFRGYDLNYIGLEDPGYYDALWGGVDGIHVLGRDLWDRAVDRGAPPDADHTIITPAIDAERITAGPSRDGVLGSPQRPLRIVSVGRLHWKKGYDYALDAVADLERRGIHVHHRIVGDGELLEAIAFWRHQHGLDEDVEMLGAVAPAAVGDQYRWADVMLHAAVSEGFCNAVLEAQAHAVPVVCSDADGLGENIEAGVTGILAPRRDPAALADGLQQLAQDPARRVRMGAAGRQRALTRFRLEDQIDAWEAFYRDAHRRRYGHP